jgi:hypothetical protein
LIITQDSWSGSDDLSFSLNGYQGIWNFENAHNFAPYNHTSSDRIGLNVNSFYNLSLLVKADIANLARIANMEPRPLNLRGLPEDGKITLTWNPNDSVDHYNVYRDSIFYVTTDDTGFVDFDVTNGVNYSYYVTSVFTNSGNESEGSSPVSAKPYPPMTFPFVDNFESGIMYWDLEPPWGLENKGISQSACLSDSPGTNYKILSNPMAFLKPLNLVGYTDSEVSFMTNYNLENNYDACFLFVFDNSLVFLDMLTGNQPNWIQRTYSLNDFLGKPDVQLYFLLYSDNSYYFDGIYIDNFTISLTLGTPESGKEDASNTSRVIPNPFSNYTSIEYVLEHDATVYLSICDYLGKEVEVVMNERQTKGKHQVQWNAEGMPAGIYFYQLTAGSQSSTGKMVVVR